MIHLFEALFYSGEFLVLLLWKPVLIWLMVALTIKAYGKVKYDMKKAKKDAAKKK